MSKFIIATVAALTLSAGITSVANATEYRRMYCQETKQYCQFKKVVCYKTVIEYKTEKEVCYKTVIDYKTETVEVVKYVTLYDHCDRPYRVKQVYCKEIEVPVKKVVPVVKEVEVPVKTTVPVVKWVKVCDEED